MSKRADARYGDQEWIAFRALVDAWITLGGARALAEFCDVEGDIVEKWRLGITTPSVAVRDAARDWMTKRAQAPVAGNERRPPADLQPREPDGSR